MTPITVLFKTRIQILVFALVFMTGCEQNINLDIPAAENLVVVEGHIENGKNPQVTVTRNARFLGTVDQSDLAKYVITNAIVIVSDGRTTDTLSLTYDANSFIPLVYKTSKITGEENKYYNLRVEADGKVLTAVTKLTNVVKLDSVWFKVDGQRDSLGFAWARLRDPDSLGNNYRWFAKRLGEDKDFIAPQGSVFQDKFVNGKGFDFAFNRGSTPNSNKEEDNNDERGFYKKGDTIAVKFCSIDFAHYDFWRSEETQVNSNGNPFAAPAPIRGNINGGLGIWGAYAAFYDTIIAK